MAEMVARPEPQVPLRLLSLALDEIYALRALCAYEAGVREADLTYRTYPKSRRDIAKDRIQKLRSAARGRAIDVVRDLHSSHSLKQSLREAGASETLVRAEWEKGHGYV